MARKRKPLPQKLRKEIKKRDGYTCQVCGRTYKTGARKFEIDHKIPVSKGGSDDPSNLRCTCWRCNRTKGSQIIDDDVLLEKRNSSRHKRKKIQSTPRSTVNKQKPDRVYPTANETWARMNAEMRVKQEQLAEQATEPKLDVLDRELLQLQSQWQRQREQAKQKVELERQKKVEPELQTIPSLLTLFVLCSILLLILWGFSGSQTKVLVLEQPKPILNIPNPEPRRDDEPPKPVIITPSWKIIKHDGMFPFSADIELIEEFSDERLIEVGLETLGKYAFKNAEATFNFKKDDRDFAYLKMDNRNVVEFIPIEKNRRVEEEKRTKERIAIEKQEAEQLAKIEAERLIKIEEDKRKKKEEDWNNFKHKIRNFFSVSDTK